MRSVKELFLTEHLDAEDLFKKAGLAYESLEDPEARYDVEHVDLLWHLASKAASNPYISLRRLPIDTPASFDVLAYAMMSCGTLAESINRLIPYSRIVSDAVTLTQAEIAGGIRIDIVPKEPPQPGRDLRLDYTITTFLAFCRWVTGRNIIPAGIELAYPRPENLDAHLLAFGCTPVFDARVHSCILATADLTRPLPTANPVLCRVHDKIVRDHLQDLSPDCVVKRMALSILPRLATGTATRKQIASDLCMSERTLQRRLEEAGTSYQKELDRVRRSLAEDHLKDQALPLQGLAYLLGFADESSFYRACRRWFAKPPGQVRGELQ